MCSQAPGAEDVDVTKEESSGLETKEDAEGANGEDIGNAKRFVDNLDDLLTNPKQLQTGTPDEWYEFLNESGYNTKPLGEGSLKGVPYEEGGGYRVNWGGDSILQYHPPGGRHGGGAYWKISSGKTGTTRYNMNGEVLTD